VDLEKALMASKQVVGEGQLNLSIPIEIPQKASPKKRKVKKAVEPTEEEEQEHE
jgi:hypothetical protein